MGRDTTSFDDDIAAIAQIAAIPKILEVITQTTGMRFAAVARVTPDRWIACSVRDEIQFGLKPGDELEVRSTICDEIRDSGKMVAINHVSEDPLWRDHHTPKTYGLQSYISVPILHQGEFFGTLCAIDPEPATPREPQIVAMFELFAELIGQHLEVAQNLAAGQAALLDANATSELKDQFIAVLGHDLRNPLASIDGGMRLMAKTPLDDKARNILGMVQSSVSRMSNLIDNVLDLARSRLGGGFHVYSKPDGNLAQTLDQVVRELQSVHPERTIVSQFAINQTVDCDAERLGQLLSNLLANALTHGADGAPVRVEARTAEGEFHLSVANGGKVIPPELLANLFKPFVRAAVANREGLGLGLYIASEIASAHGGELTVVSSETETRFTLRMPLVHR